ncbi:MAG: PAS domain-containing sensor histidine kinase [Minwuia sp.]|uniref:PAS domain-containing sensor histidine kinase n=1 Tax=Minwuia sp. TaxID=2493630 RepID=UPI003A8C5189
MLATDEQHSRNRELVQTAAVCLAAAAAAAGGGYWLFANAGEMAGAALAAIAAGLSAAAGFLAAALLTRYRRIDRVREMTEGLSGLIRGLGVYRPRGPALVPPVGELTRLPGAGHHLDLATGFARDAETLEALDGELLPEERLVAGEAVRVRAAMPSGAIVELAQHPAADGMLYVVTEDVTDAVAREADRQLKEKKLAELTELASDWTWETDTGHQLTAVSDRFTRLSGLPTERLSGRRMIEILDVRSAPVEIRSLIRHFQDQEAFSDIVVPLRLTGKHGRMWVRFAARPRFSKHGGFLGFVGVAADVTRERNAMDRARDASQALQEALVSISEGLALFGPDGRFVMCNARLANDFAPAAHLLRPGCTLQQLMNELLMTGLLRLPEVSPKGAMATVAAEVENARMRRDFLASNNRWFSVSLNRSVDGGAVMVLSDISGHKNHEAELDAKITQLETAKAELMEQREVLQDLADRLATARNEAEGANRAKSEFLAAMSHELRTPLNAIIGFSEMMASEGLGPLGNDRYNEYAHDILSSGQHLLTLINNILDLSKAEAGKLELHAQAISLTSIIEASARMACPRDREAAMQIEIEPDAEEIVADGQKVKQILINLISNAIKFTPEGGRISIHAGHRNGFTEIRIADTGIGMKKSDVTSALTPFKQIDSSLGRKFDGTGLGLPLALRFAQLHGGDLKVESAPGQGTTVIVTLPDRTPKAAVA